MAEFVKIEGLDGLLAAMKKLPPELISKKGGPCKLAMKAGAQVIRDEAKARVAVGTTDDVHVRDNIVVSRDSNPRRTDAGATERFVVRVKRKKQDPKQGPGTKNWGALEFGNERQAARPFLRPAFEAKKQTALDVIIKTLREGVAKIQAKLGK